MSSQVQGLVSTRSGDLHRVQESKTTRVSRGVGDKVVVFAGLADLIVILKETVDSSGGDLRLGLESGDGLDLTGIIVSGPEAVVLVGIEVVLEGEHIEIGSRGALFEGVLSGGESVRPAGPVVVTVGHEETVVGDVGIVEGISEGDGH